MLRYAVLGSGSSANSYIFSDGKFTFVIDNGFSGAELVRRAARAGFDAHDVSGVFLTHTHSDHIRGVGVLSRKLSRPVVMHHKLGDVFDRPPHSRINIEPLAPERFDGLKIEAFLTAHDAPHSVSYHFELGGRIFTVLTDTGVATTDMVDRVAESDVVFLEANYDPDMLEGGPYPRWLKLRIASDRGHLSNPDAVELLNNLPAGHRLKSVYFCHLSATNNSSEVLDTHVRQCLEWRGEYMICPKNALCPGVL